MYHKDLFLQKLKVVLEDCIQELARDFDRFVARPGRDFSRKARRITFEDVIWILLMYEGKSLRGELRSYYPDRKKRPKKQAFFQRRKQVLPQALQYLFRIFTDRTSELLDRTYHGYHLLACDGSSFNIERDPNDPETFIKDGFGYNQVHLNGLFDLLNRIYVDAEIAGRKKTCEKAALILMMQRYAHGKRAIFIADRGYESFNVFAHAIELGQNFMIRTKDIGSNGTLARFKLNEREDLGEEFDIDISTKLTYRQTKETKGNSEYTILSPNSEFDFIENRHDRKSIPCYSISFRVVRFKTETKTTKGYTCVITSLPREEFSADDIRKLYHLRWGEETAFRELKYAIGAVYFHTGIKEFIHQELFARLITYNFCSLTAGHAADVMIKKASKERAYKINFVNAVEECRDYWTH